MKYCDTKSSESWSVNGKKRNQKKWSTKYDN